MICIFRTLPSCTLFACPQGDGWILVGTGILPLQSIIAQLSSCDAYDPAPGPVVQLGDSDPQLSPSNTTADSQAPLSRPVVLYRELCRAANETGSWHGVLPSAFAPSEVAKGAVRDLNAAGTRDSRRPFNVSVEEPELGLVRWERRQGPLGRVLVLLPFSFSPDTRR